MEESLSYWRAQLADVPALPLPTDRPRPPLQSRRGAVVRQELDPRLIAGARGLAAAGGTSLQVVLLSVLQVLLHRYTDQADIVVGTAKADQGRDELLPIRTDLSGNPRFEELLARVRETTAAAEAHRGLPFARLAELLRVERRPSRTPVLPVGLIIAEAAVPAQPTGFGAAEFDLGLLVGCGGRESGVALGYATELFDADTAARMLEHFRMLLDSAVADPGVRIGQLRMLTDAELHRELVGWNSTDEPMPDATLPRLFHEQAARTPDAPAVLVNGVVTSYAELRSDVNRVSGWLAERGVGRGDLVGVAMAPSARRLAAVLGVLNAGAGYVPLDPSLPMERLSFMVADTAVRLVVADQPSLDLLAALGIPVHCLDADWDRLPTGARPAEVDPTDVAYVIYTSGSTGRPKGVVIEHRHAVNFASSMIRHWQVGSSDRVLHYASPNFDVSMLDIFVALLAGAGAVLVDQETRLSPPRLTELMRQAAVTLACLPPAVLSLLDADQLPSFRVMIAGGEKLSSVLAKAWLRPGLRLINAYGPTETTVVSTWADIDGSVLPPPIGRPISNCQNYVLDSYLNPVPVGVVGELHIGGAGVGRGYLNRPELTAERYIADPFSGVEGARLYKSGDLVKRLPDGRISCLGRADGQVKLHGQRIELGEVERAVLSHPGVTQAVVVLRDDPVSGAELVGYYRGDTSTEDLRSHLAGWLPTAMVPAKLVALEKFPLTHNGKIDKSALPAPDLDVRNYVAPSTLVETVLTDMYASLLHQVAVGVEDSFFDVGGSSLLAMRLVARLREELAVDLDITSIFRAPTARQLAALLRDRYELEDAELGDDGLGGLIEQEPEPA